MMNRMRSNAKALLALILAIMMVLFPMDTLALTMEAQGSLGDESVPTSEYAATPDEAAPIESTEPITR